MRRLELSPADNPLGHPAPQLVPRGSLQVCTFEAMASPCEILMSGVAAGQAARLARPAVRETWRIESCLSRYRADNLVARINRSSGEPVPIDAELDRLLEYADQCHQLSEGRFDITSGVLRRAWRFDGSDQLPDASTVSALLPLVGWPKVERGGGWVRLPPGMEIDLGGIGKEYAVDRVLMQLVQAAHQAGLAGAAFLVNFGGDLACSGPQDGDRPWQIGIESALSDQSALRQVALRQGGLATSGDSRRYLLKDGIRYGHILDPRTGWPVPDAPRSVTVSAATCTVAGMLATFAMLNGAQAEHFLSEQPDIRYWVQR